MNLITIMMRQCRPSDGIPEEKYQNVLACFRGETRLSRKGATPFQIGECQKWPGVVMDGTLRISLYSEDSNLVTVGRLRQGQVLGETLVCSMAKDGSVQIDALTDVQVLYLGLNPLFLQQECVCPHRAQATASLLHEMGRSALFLNQKMRILAQNRSHNWIRLYPQTLPVKFGGGLHLDMGRDELAGYLRVDRNVPFRGLGRMQKEGILAFQGQQVRILDQSFFDVQILSIRYHDNGQAFLRVLSRRCNKLVVANQNS